MTDIKFGIQLSARHKTPKDWNELKSTALLCEKLDYNSIWLGDHLTTGDSRLECWTALSALSQTTNNIRLGTMVLCNNFRNPALLAKMAATLDVISDGRLELGIGAGWHEGEHITYGYDFPSPYVRLNKLREGVKILKMMWTEDKPSFKGKHYVIEEPLCEPKPVQKPHPPITIGGSGEKYTLKVVAAFADRWNYIGDINQYKQKLSALEKHCKKMGRDPNDIDKTYHTSMEIYTDENEFLNDMKKIYESGYYGRRPIEETSFDEWLVRFQSRAIVGKSETCLERIKEMIDLGITYFIFSARGLAARRAPDLKRRNASLQRFADEVISQI